MREDNSGPNLTAAVLGEHSRMLILPVLPYYAEILEALATVTALSVGLGLGGKLW